MKTHNIKSKNILVIPQITSTGAVVPDGKVKVYLGKSCDGLESINDENHCGSRDYYPRLIFNVAISIISSWCPGTSQERKKSNVTMIEFVTSGRGELIVDDIKYQLQPNDIYFLHRNENHFLRALPPDRFCKHGLTLLGDVITELMKKMGIKNISHIRLSKSKAKYVLAEIKEIDKLICEKTDGFRSNISTKLFALLIFLANEVYGEPKKDALPEEIESCMEYVINNIDKRLKLPDLAREARISVNNLNRLFMQALETTPYRWLYTLKMNLSAYDLLNTRMKIHTIAEKYGYADQFHFSHSFKRVFAMSPTKYRLLLHGDIKKRK